MPNLRSFLSALHSYRCLWSISLSHAHQTLPQQWSIDNSSFFTDSAPLPLCSTILFEIPPKKNLSYDLSTSPSGFFGDTTALCTSHESSSS